MSTSDNFFERTEKEYQGLLQKYDWFDYMPWIRRWLLRLIRNRDGEYWMYNQDTHCFIDCKCGNRLSVDGDKFSANEEWITWCPRCGRGYSTEFRCYCYPFKFNFLQKPEGRR